MTVPARTVVSGSSRESCQAVALAEGARVERPWGWFETLAFVPPSSGPEHRDGYVVKRLWIAPSCRISLQRHHHRSEHWVVVAGQGELECGDERIAAEPGTTLFVPVGAFHRAGAGAEGLLIVEVQRGDELREDDIERVADDYGRVVGSCNNL